MSLPQLSVSKSTDRQSRKRGGNPPRNGSKVARMASTTQNQVSQPENTHPQHLTTTTSASTKAIMELDLSRRPISTSSESSTGSCSSSPTNSTDSEDQAENVVDLTSDKEDPIVVDLTSPVTMVAEVDLTSSIATVAAKARDTICLSETEDSDVMILPSTPPSKPRVATSPDITCPICMDSKRTFARSGRTLVSTKCGHLFCDACLKQSIELMHKCPTCSGKLTLKQFHRIYI